MLVTAACWFDSMLLSASGSQSMFIGFSSRSNCELIFSYFRCGCLPSLLTPIYVSWTLHHAPPLSLLPPLSNRFPSYHAYRYSAAEIFLYPVSRKIICDNIPDGECTEMEMIGKPNIRVYIIYCFEESTAYTPTASSDMLRVQWEFSLWLETVERARESEREQERKKERNKSIKLMDQFHRRIPIESKLYI